MKPIKAVLPEVVATVVRAAYAYDKKAASDACVLRCSDETRTVQSHKEECDINTIVRRFGITGKLPENVRMPISGDFTQVEDFSDAMAAVVAARESFAAMPSAVRERFNNDPSRFVDFCLDEGNRDEAVKLGLVVPTKPVEVVATGVPVAPAAS